MQTLSQQEIDELAEHHGLDYLAYTPFARAIEAAQQKKLGNQSLLDSIRRLSAGEHLVGDQVCVFGATLGIDTMPVGSTPGGESVRVYVYTDNPHALSLQALAAFLCIPQPLVEAAMQDVSVLKYCAQSLKVLALVPSHADGLNLLAHVNTPCIDESAIVVQGGAA